MAKTDKHAAIYLRVSSNGQDTRSQEPDLRRWAAAQDGPVRWYRDKATGKNMNRPGWDKLYAGVIAGKVDRIVVWRLDRLGRTVSGLAPLFEELINRKVPLVSIREGFDLMTPPGRLMANLLASMAQFETELRGERVRAGQVAARRRGIRWGGSKPGIRKQVTDVQLRTVHRLRAAGETIADIARTVKLSRPTIYAMLKGE